MSVPPLTPADFPAFFAAVHGAPPFPWQERLLRRVAEDEAGKWPKTLGLPTGSGKTAALDIAVFHLALAASRRVPRRAPVRIAFVVDRRLIVDDAYGRAERLALALRWSLLDDAGVETLKKQLVKQQEEADEKEAAEDRIKLLDRVRAQPTVRAAALRLRELAGEGEAPLLARRLRGGAPREDDWARTPVQPTILCSTVDQVGSRLLFRGYGVSDRMKPIHAGLLGSDCLILLDEAHLAEPFRQTLAAVDRLRAPDAAPWQTVVLTATPWRKKETEEIRHKPFGLCDEDRRHPVLSQRLAARKPTRLIEIPGRQGVPVETRRVEEIAEQTKEILRELGETMACPVVGVVVNRVLRARAVFERLQSGFRETAHVILVIGPARSIDRDVKIVEELGPIRTGAKRELPRPMIVVATQTIEAGVDIDLDGLVTEAAPLDALRQRFGRLNRAGRPIDARGVVLAHRDDIAAKADDPVYGSSAAETWKALHEVAGEGSVIDFGIDAFPHQLLDDPDKLKKLVSPKPDAPVLMPAYADLWSQTSPIPNADPEVGLFLHGPDRSPASVQIVWRADIREADLAIWDARERILGILALVPPRAAEAIEVPLWTARAWLKGQPGSFDALSDASEVAPEEVERGSRGKPVFRYAGSDNVLSAPIFLNDVRPGDLIVVPATYGGCDRWGWNPDSPAQTDDVAEAAAMPYSARRFALRLTPEIVTQDFRRSGSDGDGNASLAAGAAGRAFSSLLAEGDNETASDLLDRLAGSERLPSTTRQRLNDLKKRYKRRLECRFPYGYDADEGPTGVVFLAPFGLAKKEGDAAASDLSALPATESDDIGLATGYPLLLTQHSKDVRCWACAFAARAGLPDRLASDVALAGYLHDQGKSDPRFQAYLAGGDLLGWDEREVLAKSGRNWLPKDAWKRAGLPDDWRHEALSVRLANRHPLLGEADDAELVLWLIGVHHGFGRPLFPHADPDEPADRPGPQCLDFDFRGRDWTQIFEELKRRYGIWGLARLEAFVRLADHRASEAAERRYAEGEP